MTSLCVLETSACTSVGLTAAASAAAVRCALSGFTEYSRATDRLGEPVIVAAPPGVAEIAEPERGIATMVQAVIEVFSEGARVPAFVVLPETRPGLRKDLFTYVVAELKERVPEVRIAPAKGSGHAGAASAFVQAAEYLDTHARSVVAVIGADSYLHPETITWLDQHRQLHALYNAWGFIPGAAAGGVLLCHERLAREKGLLVRGIIEEIAIEQEVVPIKSEGVCLGRAMSSILEKLLKDQPEGPVIDMVYCDQNGEAYRADEMGFMLTRASDRFRSPSSFVTPADCWGDVGAASLPLFIALATEAADRGYAPGPLSVHLAGSESGLRAGIRLRTAVRDG